MAEFLNRPNIPDKKVGLCAVSDAQEELLAFFQKERIQALPVPWDPRLPFPVSGHPDMLLHHLGGEEVLIHPNAEPLGQQLQNLGFSVKRMDLEPKSAYPGDCGLNACVVGDHVFLKETLWSRVLAQAHQKKGRRIQPVKQGYAKCSAAVVGSHALITADPTIYAGAVRCGVDALFITPGHIILPGYSYGFIGGTCGLIDAQVLLFCGDLSTHPSCREILAFLKKHHVEAVCCGKGLLKDVGSILPLAYS